MLRRARSLAPRDPQRRGELCMTERADTAITRRRFLKTGTLAAAAAPLIARASRAEAATKVLDFSTNADVAKAEAEGEVVYYGHDSEPGIAVLLDAFEDRKRRRLNS